MRVSFVVGTTTGGMGRHVAMLARGCARAGLEVQVLAPAAARWILTRHDEGAGGPGSAAFTAVPISDRPRPVSDWTAVWRIRRAVAGWDVVHAHGLRAGALAALALALSRSRRIALVVTVHNAAPAGGGSAVVYRVLERLVAGRADSVLCVAPDLAERMRRLSARRVALASVPAPANVNQASGAGPAPGAGPELMAEPGALDQPDAGSRASATSRASAGQPGVDVRMPEAGRRPVVLAVGRLTPQKGFDVLLDAAARWVGKSVNPIVRIAGAGPSGADLVARANALRVDAEFLGHRDDVPALIAGADVVVLPSRWEGQPMVLQEALRAGRPIVATRVGGVPDLTGPDAALLIRAADADALSEAVLRVLDDPALARRLSLAAARRFAALPTEEEAVGDVLDLYAGLARR